MLVLPSNAVSPTTVTLRFLSPLFGPDLSTVSAVNSGIQRRDGTTGTLAFTVVSATSRELLAQYTVQDGDLTTTGAYFLAPQLTIPNVGVVASETVPLFVAGPYSCLPQLEADAWLLATVPIPSAAPNFAVWRDVSSNIVASPFSPRHALDLRSQAVSVTLWAGKNGDSALFSDVYSNAASHNFTLTAPGSSKVPVGDGTYATSHVYTTNGFVLRLRFRASDGLWLPE